MPHVVGIRGLLAPNVVVKHAALGGLMNVRQRQIHPIAFDRVRDATDEDDCAVPLDALHHAEMSERVIQDAVAVKVPGVVEKYEVSGANDRPLVERSMLPKMRIDQTNAVRSRIPVCAVIEIDAVLQENRSRHAGAIVCDASAPTLNRLRP